MHGSVEFVVAFIISTFSPGNTGRGGHYYSCYSTVDELKQKCKETFIINVGDFRAPSIESREDFKFFDIKTRTFRKNISAITEYCRQKRVTHIHSFDEMSAYIARVIAEELRIPVIHTKPGGPIPPKRPGNLSRLYYPALQNTLVFHDADFDWFKARRRPPKNLILARERVKDIPLNVKRAELLSGFFAETKVKILRIGRIGQTYRSVIEQAINLTKTLNQRGISAKLAVIGHIESYPIYSMLKKLSGPETGYFVENRFTNFARDFLAIADVAIGTGRTFLEGCAAGCVMMAPVADSDVPALVRDWNVLIFERHNFSKRTLAKELSNEDLNFESILKLFQSDKDLASIKVEMRKLFEDRYNIDLATKKLLEVYKLATAENIIERKTPDYYVNTLHFMSVLLRNSLKKAFPFHS